MAKVIRKYRSCPWFILTPGTEYHVPFLSSPFCKSLADKHLEIRVGKKEGQSITSPFIRPHLSNIWGAELKIQGHRENITYLSALKLRERIDPLADSLNSSPGQYGIN